MKYTFAFLAIAFSSLALNAENRADSIKTNKINEVTVLGGLSGSFALPMAVVNKSTIEKNSFYTPADALRRENVLHARKFVAPVTVVIKQPCV